MNFYSFTLALLGVSFVVLKLLGVISWSWWLVTIPLWGALGIWLALVAVVALAALLTFMATLMAFFVYIFSRIKR